MGRFYLPVPKALLLLACLTTCTAARTTYAQQDQGTLAIRQGAEALTLYEQGRWEEALAAFTRADELYHSPVFSLYIARSLRSSGRLLAAKSVFEKLSLERLPEQAPAAWIAAQRDGHAELAALERDLPRVLLVLERGSVHARVTIDGKAADTGKSFAADPGSHHVEVVDGARRLTKTVSLAPGAGLQRIMLDLGPPEQTLRRGWFAPGLIVAGLGGAAVVASGVTALLATTKTETVRNDFLPRYCDGKTCPMSRRQDIETQMKTADRLDSATGVLLVSGVAMAAVGVAMVWVDRRPNSTIRASRAARAAILGFRF